MPLALVTGATGLVGSYLVERLRRDGWQVRALVRDPARAAWLGDEAELIRGDVLDAGVFRAAAAGCDTIFHAAAAVTPRGGWEAYRRPNIDGTRNAIEAAAAAGAKMLHVSSVAVYGPRARYESATGATDERTPLAPLPEAAHYARSKRESEAMVLAAHREGRIWATAIRPSVIYGRRDRQFVPRVARLLRLGAAPLIGDGRNTLAIVHAANVADGALRAAAAPAAGGVAYNVANDGGVSVRDFVRLAGEGLGRRIAVIPVPRWLAHAGLFAAKSGVSLLKGGSVALRVGSTLDFLTRDNPFSSDLARRELGWTPVMSPEVGVPEAFRWWLRESAA